MPPITAVIFDMYETLVVNTTSLWVETFDDICRHQALGLTGQELWDRWKPVEMVFRKERLHSDGNGALPPFKSYYQAWLETFEQVFNDIGKGDAKHAAQRSLADQGLRELYSETAEVLERLHDIRNLPVGLLSNSDNDALLPLVKRHGLRFDAVVSSESARAYKPLGQPFQVMVEALGVDARSCLYVGDSQLDDVKGGKDAGMQTAWLNRHQARLDPALPLPDYHVRDLREILNVLDVAK